MELNNFKIVSILVFAVLATSIVSLGEKNLQLEDKLDENQDRIKDLNNTLIEEKNKPVVWAGSPSWAETEVNSGTYRFNLFIYNGGSSQASNINLVCGLYNDNNFDKKFVHNAGNLAAESSKDAVFDKDLENVQSSSAAACVVKNCSDCVTPRKNLDFIRKDFSELIKIRDEV